MIRIIIGSILAGIGFFLIRESFGYGGESVAILVGVPFAIIGIMFVLKGGKQYLSNDD